MKVYVISLKRAMERREFMVKQLEKFKLNYEIIDAVDYKELSEEDFNRLTDREAVAKNPCLTEGMIACSLSHVKIFNKMVKEQVEMALILEDDAILPNNISDLLKFVEKNIKQDEVIALSYYNHNSRDTFLSKDDITTLENGSQLVYPIDLHRIASTMAYVTTLNVVAKLKDVLMPVSVQPDYWGVYFDKNAFTSFRCLYPVPVKPALFRSTLNYASAGTLKSKVAAFVREYKIPGLLDYLNKRDQSLLNQKYRFVFTNDRPFLKK